MIQIKQKKCYRLDKYKENQQNAARKWTEQKKKYIYE
jgi:hypothetical protein